LVDVVLVCIIRQVGKREQERDHYREYNMKLLAHNTNLRTAVRQHQDTAAGSQSAFHNPTIS
jgi:hypothetical protein